MRKINILHIFADEKFFDPVSNYFDSFSNIDNRYLFYIHRKDYKFKMITNVSKITLCHNFFRYVKSINDNTVDIIYFHGMVNPYLVNFISSQKKIIWWCFGYEIYSPFYLLKPILPIEIFKPETKKCRNSILLKKINCYIKTFYGFLFVMPFRKQFIRRVDYFSPVLPIDYELMKKHCKRFKAKPFMYYSGPGVVKENSFGYKIEYGKILIGNSLTYENNHLDIFEKLRSINREERQQLIIPVSYGNDYGGVLNLKQKANLSNAVFLSEFLPRADYFSYLKAVTHAIFGNIRQQAMGNINWCLRNGIKIYMYKDSVVFKQLICFGYKIFSIDDDLTEDSLKEPLSKIDAEKNYKIALEIRGKSALDKELEQIMTN